MQQKQQQKFKSFMVVVGLPRQNGSSAITKTQQYQNDSKTRIRTRNGKDNKMAK